MVNANVSLLVSGLFTKGIGLSTADLVSQRQGRERGIHPAVMSLCRFRHIAALRAQQPLVCSGFGLVRSHLMGIAILC